MRLNRLIGIALLLVAAPVAAQSVTIDYAKGMDFSSVKTFQYVETKETNASNPMMGDRIVASLKAELTAAGLREITENPDIYVTYHLTARQNQELNTTGYGYGGVGRRWGRFGGGMVDATTTVTTYTEGTLIIDAYRAADKKMVWRGAGTVTVASKPEKQSRQVQKILDKLGSKWQKILESSNQGSKN